MTTSVNADASAATDEASARKRWRWWMLAAVLVLLAAAVPSVVWWRVSVDRYQLHDNGLFHFGPQASLNRAGDYVEICYPLVAGQTIELGFPVSNDGTHTVTLTSVDPIFPGLMQQSVAVDRDNHGGQDGRASAVRLPVTLHPGDARVLYFQLTQIAGVELSDSEIASTGVVGLHFTVLGSARVQNFQIGDGYQFITLVNADPTMNACDRYVPPQPNAT